LFKGEAFPGQHATQRLAKGRRFLWWQKAGFSAGKLIRLRFSNFCKAKANRRTVRKSSPFYVAHKGGKGGIMKPNVILLVDADADTCAATLAAARTLRLDIRYAQVACDLSEITECGLDDIAVIVLDVDPDVHWATIAEMLQDWRPPRPVILISSVEDAPHSVRRPSREARYISKPVSIERLTEEIAALARSPQLHPSCCDRWGHPFESCENSCASIPEEEGVVVEQV